MFPASHERNGTSGERSSSPSSHESFVDDYDAWQEFGGGSELPLDFDEHDLSAHPTLFPWGPGGPPTAGQQLPGGSMAGLDSLLAALSVTSQASDGRRASASHRGRRGGRARRRRAATVTANDPMVRTLSGASQRRPPFCVVFVVAPRPLSNSLA